MPVYGGGGLIMKTDGAVCQCVKGQWEGEEIWE